MKINLQVLLIGIFLWAGNGFAQPGKDYWQQRVEYTMEIDFDVVDHQFQGKQRITYFNNSPDTLERVFYYLFYNAFQPYSMMDMRSRTISDPDGRVRDRILGLGSDEIGYQKILSLSQDGEACRYETVGTILEVTLPSPILPGDSSLFEMEFEAQVPIQIRRTGRNNKEGIDYSMTQWYPKLCEYDKEGWHAHPYVAREFHGVWGDYDVKITIDSSYTIGASGYLQNPEAIGHGYGEKNIDSDDSQLTWHFVAPMVHDFAWAADPDYVHDKIQVPDGPEVHFFYQPETEKIEANWKELQAYCIKLFQLASETFGTYPYDTYSVIQGGDGGMEYPMATLVTGKRSMRSLIGVTTHEVMHSWYQMVLAINEAKYPWMDEGFTTFADNYLQDIIFEANSDNPQIRSYMSYEGLVQARIEEPMATHGDHYRFNSAYGTATYSKGAIFLHQLSYIIGKETFFKAFKFFFDSWKFKHPEPRDVKRIMEKASDLELDWYWEYMINSTKFINYSIDTVYQENNRAKVTLLNAGEFPMPLDVSVTYIDGSQEIYNIPLRIMRGHKSFEAEAGVYSDETSFTLIEDWPWTHPVYEFSLDRPLAEVKSIEIDPSGRLADIDRGDNEWEKE
ncbi:MAG: M1 family metallopeptidase [Bacteroidota bacterium]